MVGGLAEAHPIESQHADGATNCVSLIAASMDRATGLGDLLTVKGLAPKAASQLLLRTGRWPAISNKNEYVQKMVCLYSVYIYRTNGTKASTEYHYMIDKWHKHIHKVSISHGLFSTIGFLDHFGSIDNV